MGTRLLTGLAATVFATGCGVEAIGLVPAVSSPEVTRIGLLVAIASLPSWITAASKRASEATKDQLADAREAGYVLAMRHVETATRPVRIPQPHGISENAERHGH